MLFSTVHRRRGSHCPELPALSYQEYDFPMKFEAGTGTTSLGEGLKPLETYLERPLHISETLVKGLG